MNTKTRFSGLVLASLLAIPITSHAAPGDLYSGTVISVIDAQTVRLARHGGGEIRVRLPEALSEAALRDRYQGHSVIVEEQRWDKGLIHGEIRTIATQS